MAAPGRRSRHPRPGRWPALVAGMLLAVAAGVVAPSPAAAQVAAPGRRVVLADDFSGAVLDEKVWNVERTGNFNRIYNNELQSYADDRNTVYIDHDDAATGATNGALALHARPFRHTVTYDDPDGTRTEKVFDYVSGRVNTEGKFSFRYGSMAARMKLPALPGTWPAFWSMGLDASRWPVNGEIDVMENVGERAWTSGGIHFPARDGAGAAADGTTGRPAPRGWPTNEDGRSGPVGRTSFPGFDAGDWHVYRVDWSPAGLVFLVDGQEWQRVTPEQIAAYGTWVFDQPQYLLLNMAIGGEYPAAVDPRARGGLPDGTRRILDGGAVRTLVDWVRVTENRPGAGIEAESADQVTGIMTVAAPHGGGAAGLVSRGDVLRFDQVDLGVGSTEVRIRASSSPPRGQTGQVEFRADRPDAPPFAIVDVAATGGWDRYATFTAGAAAPAGVHTVYATFVSPAPWHFVTIDSVAFIPRPALARADRLLAKATG